MIFRGIALASFLAIPALAQSAVDSADLSQSDSSWIINGSVGAEFRRQSLRFMKMEEILSIQGKNTEIIFRYLDFLVP